MSDPNTTTPGSEPAPETREVDVVGTPPAAVDGTVVASKHYQAAPAAPVEPQAAGAEEAAVPADAAAGPKPWVLPAVTGGAGLILGLIIGFGIPALSAGVGSAATAVGGGSTLFQDVVDECGANAGADVADEGKTLTVDGEGEEALSGDVSFDQLDCIIDGTGAPTSVKTLMYETRSVDGRQSDSWDNVEASWSYHPDQGLDIIFEIVE